MIIKTIRGAFRGRKIFKAVNLLRLEYRMDPETQMEEINRLVRELKLNKDEENLVFAFFWSHDDLFAAFGLSEAQVFQIDFDKVKRLPPYFLKYVYLPDSSPHPDDDDFYKGIITVRADPKTGKISLEEGKQEI